MLFYRPPKSTIRVKLPSKFLLQCRLLRPQSCDVLFGSQRDMIRCFARGLVGKIKLANWPLKSRFIFKDRHLPPAYAGR